MKRLHSIQQERYITEEQQMVMHGLFHDLRLHRFKIENGNLSVLEFVGTANEKWTDLNRESILIMWATYGRNFVKDGKPLDMSVFSIEVL